jgi:hypothetical protein
MEQASIPSAKQQTQLGGGLCAANSMLSLLVVVLYMLAQYYYESVVHFLEKNLDKREWTFEKELRWARAENLAFLITLLVKLGAGALVLTHGDTPLTALLAVEPVTQTLTAPVLDHDEALLPMYTIFLSMVLGQKLLKAYRYVKKNMRVPQIKPANLLLATIETGLCLSVEFWAFRSVRGYLSCYQFSLILFYAALHEVLVAITLFVFSVFGMLDKVPYLKKVILALLSVYMLFILQYRVAHFVKLDSSVLLLLCFTEIFRHVNGFIRQGFTKYLQWRAKTKKKTQ